VSPSPITPVDPPNDSPEYDVEDIVIAYLAGFGLVPDGHVAARIPENMVLPWVLVTRVAGGDDWIVDYATVQVDSFHGDQTAASTLARAVHHQMRQLRPQLTVELPSGRQAKIYRYATHQTPIYVPWEPEGGGLIMSRYVGVYELDVRLPSIPGY